MSRTAKNAKNDSTPNAARDVLSSVAIKLAFSDGMLIENSNVESAKVARRGKTAMASQKAHRFNI
ncbi:MAG: hypothetical protein NTX81_01010 [Candidatus Bathyarchaeota archaeon]|nr:hypothetical protein [Candidatus Bathyarchaeota archaeon]